MTEPADPTELAGVAEMGTEQVEAWSAAEDYPLTGSWDDPERRWTPKRITVAAVVASVLVVGGVAGAAVWKFRGTESDTVVTHVVVATATTAVPEPPMLQQVAPKPPPVSALVTLPADTFGSVWVGTQSGKTICHLSSRGVTCYVQFDVPTPLYGEYATPSNVVSITAQGSFTWGIGDVGQNVPTTIRYGTVYRALGWTIAPTSTGTTFTYDATGHGMTVSVEGADPF